MITDNWVYWRFKNGHEPLGEFGEAVWKNVIESCGFRYVQLSTLPPLRGKGPRLQGSDERFADFEVTAGMECQRVYMDSKCKTKPCLYVNANSLRHGIDKTAYEDYAAIAGIHRQKCLLGIVELFCEDDTTWSGSLLVNSLGRLGRPVPGFSNQSHMVYWPRSLFIPAGAYSPSALWKLANGESPATEQTTKVVHDAFVIQREHVQSRLW